MYERIQKNVNAIHSQQFQQVKNEKEQCDVQNQSDKILYFMKGNFQRQFTQSQQKQIWGIFNNSKKLHSIFIYNSSLTKKIYQNWKQKLSWIEPYYAYKSNPHEYIIQDLINLGSSFDCASRLEIQDLLKKGVKPEKIIYSNSVKDQNQLKWTGQHKIAITTADSIYQIQKIKKYAPQMRILWRIAINQNNESYKSNFAQKFGDNIQTELQIHQRMKQISQSGINLLGIHFHCGSKNMGTSSYPIAIKLARKCIQIGRIYNHQMSILDIGGGISGDTLSEITIQELKQTQNDELNYKVIAEPGRHFCASTFSILLKVIGQRQRYRMPCYHLNDSLYHSLNNLAYPDLSFDNEDDQFYSKIEFKTGNISSIKNTQKSDLYGMTCCGLDVLAKNISTPTQLKCQDWICMPGMGAYTYCLKSNFNGMESTNQVLIWNPKLQNQ